MYFRDHIGHHEIKEGLNTLVKNSAVGHAYIFDGPEGVGKLMLARIFAGAVLCVDYNEDNCGLCKSCRLSFNDTHPDIRVVDLTIDEDGQKRSSISVESVRRIKQDIFLKPFFAQRKIYILKNADKMTREAQNALLKVFEEPPDYAVIILISNDLAQFLPTILSRAVVKRFSPLSPDELAIYIERVYNDLDNKEVAARICGGSVKKLSQIVENPGYADLRGKVLEGMDLIINSGISTAVNSLFSVFVGNKDEKEEIVDILTKAFFDIVYIKTGNKNNIVNIDEEGKLSAYARELTIDNIYNIVKLMQEMMEQIERNANYKLSVINTLNHIWEEIHG